MQALNQLPQPSQGHSTARTIGYFLMPLLVGLALFALLVGAALTFYQSRHSGRVFTGVSVWGADLSELTPAEAQAALAGTVAFPEGSTYTLIDPTTSEQWTFTPQQLGVTLDVERTTQAAFEVGRSGGPLERLRQIFQSWYYGQQLSPIIVFDEGQMNRAIEQIAATVEQEPVSAVWDTNGTQPVYTPAQAGRALDREDLRQRLMVPVKNLQPAELELLVHDVIPPVYDDPTAASRYERLLTQPLTFYFTEPLQDLDLSGITLSPEEMSGWIRTELVTTPDGHQTNNVFIDENAARTWLAQYANQIYREPVNARYYFNDDTHELVLVAPHVNGRELDVDATIDAMRTQLEDGNLAVPLIVNDIVPAAHSGATAAELGITELITENTTWFYGSSDERKHNIARAAANFYGIVVEPGEEFSFNKYLGSISEADGYEEGLIIVGGRTIKGVGGGVCQVSTTLYQSAFWSGFPIVERWEHGYMVGYYNDGEGQGMDATVFSPVVDLRFINNTPYHLLIENYYNEENESLTFKFYSTSMGREIVKEQPVYENEVEAPADDVWEFDPDLPEGTVEQYDYATEGADVTVKRLVYNADGELIEERDFVSHYIPWPNVYRYGPGVEPGDYSLVPEPEF
ncbi:MAG: VanW family protein [Chloroflexota bacterium]